MVLIPIVIILVLSTTQFWISLVIAVVAFIGARELLAMVSNRSGGDGSDEGGWRFLGALPAAVLPVFVYFSGFQIILPYLTLTVFVCIVLRLRFGRDLTGSFNWLLGVLLSVFYLAIPLTAFVGIKSFEGGGYWILFVLVIVWANDTFAYYSGRLIGSTKLSPVISPNKTYEGAVGGLVGGVVIAFLYNHFLSMGLGIFELIILAIILGVIGIIGDLAESLIKRATGVKDSGNLIPGHGGLLDRIDSLIFTIPVIYYYLLWQGVAASG